MPFSGSTACVPEIPSSSSRASTTRIGELISAKPSVPTRLRGTAGPPLLNSRLSMKSRIKEWKKRTAKTKMNSTTMMRSSWPTAELCVDNAMTDSNDRQTAGISASDGKRTYRL